ncbi:MAG: UvrD-helicase domain-containing protein [Candidatus Cloacimonetes bacterium]|nr:UvrD-helicase domain-containing protein [Candidatus Cloacimonadota bacterium]
MNSNILQPNIIRASAGTGKTYRLSLEYIALLLKLKDEINFDEILVITFTKKATAEIRQRIIEFLHHLTIGGKKADELKTSLKAIYDDLDFSPENIDYITHIYKKIITSKSRLNISTLDSFINTIFKSLIAPYHNITGYTIDPLINNDILPEIYNTILSDENFPLLENIFKYKQSRNISAYNDFIKAIMDNRWLFEFYYKSRIDAIDHLTLAEYSYNQLLAIAKDFCQRFNWIYNEYYSAKTWDKVFAKDWYNALNENDNLKSVAPDAIGDHLLSLLSDRDFLVQKYSLLSSSKNIWNGGTLLRGAKMLDYKDEITELQDQLYTAWRNLLFYKLVLPEQQDILELSRIIFQKYDEIKFRDKILTFNDLTAYTWKYLYDPEISIINQNEVLNLFYEQISYRIKFILIDEFQDTSILQWNIFAPLIREIISGIGSSESGSFTVVGDEKQAIYSWRSGERELLVGMEKLLDVKFRSENLTTSYRSSKAVIEFVNRLFSDQYFKDNLKIAGLSWDYSHIEAIKSEPGFVQVQINNLKNDDQEKEFSLEVEEFIKNIYLPAVKEDKISPTDTAILTRTHKEMNTIAAVLREMEIDYLDETSLSILEHRAIKPVLALMHWLYNLDFTSLLVFLRSDAVLLDSKELKDILVCWQNCANNNTAFNQTLISGFSSLLPVKIISELAALTSEPLLLTQAIIKKFNLTNIFDQESDLANLSRFIDIIAGFLAENLDYTHDLGGVLRYLADNQKSEAFIQSGIQQQDVIKILTIHKSKGLEFDTVILIQNCPRNSSHLPELYIAPNYTADFSALDGAIFTYNFKSLLKDSPVQPLLDLQNKRQCIEAINVWYVALTRAKRNLFALITYSIKEGWQKFVESFQPDKPDINKLLVGSLTDAFAIERIEQDASLLITLGELNKYNAIKDVTSSTLTGLKDISPWFSSPPPDYFQPRDNWQDKIPPENLQQLASSQISGNIAHYYLEQIRFDSPENRRLAAQRTIAFYGSLMPVDHIKAVIQNTDSVLSANADLFDTALWEEAYCEWSIFDNHKREFRIDRLLVSHQRKEIQVVDYKTGEITDIEQINKYNKLIREIPFVKNQGYTVLDGIFLKIEIK